MALAEDAMRLLAHPPVEREGDRARLVVNANDERTKAVSHLGDLNQRR